MPARRLLLLGLTAAATYFALAALALLVLGSPVLARWMGLSGVLAGAVAVVLHRLLTRRRPPGDDDPGPEDEPPPGDEPPPWWPAFEREFRAYCEGRDRPRTRG